MAIRLRYLADLNPSKSELKGLSSDTEVSFLPMEAIGERGDLDLSQTRPLGEASSGYTFVRDDDVVIAKITPCFENGKGAYISGLINGIGFGTTELIVVRAKKARINPRFLSYVFQSPHFRKPAEGHMTGAGGQKRVPDDFVRDFRIDVTDCTLQDKIVGYLDRETAEIDALIEKQERLIALLEEKRQAFISHALTKGLDPTAPMKDSGIPWVGLIPAHWELQKLRTLVTIEKRIAGTLGYDVFSITQRGLKVKDLDSADGQHSMDYSKYQIVEPGDFAMNHMDLLTGYVDIAQRQGVTSPDYRVFRLKSSSSVLARFLLLVLQDAYRRRVLYAFGQGSSNLGRWRLPSEAFYGFPVALPSQSEQLEIVSEVARFEDDTEKLVSACRKAAHVLRERRASLISAAVTGKIDVTGRV